MYLHGGGRVIGDYNTRRPHQSLDMASPADRFAPLPQEEREALPLRLPPALRTIPAPAASQPQTATEPEPDPLPRLPLVTPGAVEFDRVVPASGNVFVEGRQFWLGPARAGITITFWADHDVIHLLAGGRPAGPPPLPPADNPGAAVEVDRVVSTGGAVSLLGRPVLAAEILAGQRVSVRIDDTTDLLRSRDPPTAPHSAQPLHLRPGPSATSSPSGPARPPFET
jgi:hypothetical protein